MADITSLIKSRPARRILLALAAGILFVLSLTHLQRQSESRAQRLSLATTPKCDSTASTNISAHWEGLEEKYKKLPDDKFTWVSALLMSLPSYS